METQENIKRHRVRVGLSDAEFKAVQILAEKEQLSPANFLKKLTRNELENKNIEIELVKPEKNGTRKRVWITLSDSEFEKLRKLSLKEGVKQGDLVKASLINMLESVEYVPTSIQEELQELRFLIRNIANNVNQMAWHSNRVKYVVDENKLFVELQKLQLLIAEYATGKLKRKEDDH